MALEQKWVRSKCSRHPGGLAGNHSLHLQTALSEWEGLEFWPDWDWKNWTEQMYPAAASLNKWEVVHISPCSGGKKIIVLIVYQNLWICLKLYSEEES